MAPRTKRVQEPPAKCIVTNLRLTAAGLQRRFYLFRELFKALLCLNKHSMKGAAGIFTRVTHPFS
jgi:hypothetical protein